MTGSHIQPVVFPATRMAPSSSPAARLPLPLPVSPLTRSSAAIYGAAAVDNRGRIIEKPLLTRLGWSPGTGVDIQESQGRLIIHPNECFVTMITKHGHLRLPACTARKVVAPGQTAE
ncbi:hypothetical protein [Kibdelosporangium aridum]|uniref:Uncharacterized protein n=1 Tax=Kibdelosporangium aridum TaxID=2030 RepID=A0A1W2FWY1_KIBAR|nr:hypothetical protein [Kibdelosporangium aridum]SMD26467.1 hypothetical protein SAMN05661093_10050 [Kibdelosporangium aridum]